MFGCTTPNSAKPLVTILSYSINVLSVGQLSVNISLDLEANPGLSTAIPLYLKYLPLFQSTKTELSGNKTFPACFLIYLPKLELVVKSNDLIILLLLKILLTKYSGFSTRSIVFALFSVDIFLVDTETGSSVRHIIK